jgi:flagellar basal body-associated protein FliL
MSEETNNDGTWSGMKKTIIGTLTTVITGGGVWLSTILFGGHAEEPKEETKTEQAAPAAAPVIVNVQQNQENKQKVENGGGTVIRERVIEKPSTQPAAPVQKPQEESW